MIMKTKFITKKISRVGQMPLLQDRLILNRFLCRLFGFDDFEGFQRLLCNTRQGPADDGHSHFYHALQGEQGLRVSPDQLAAYDLRIKDYMEKLNRFRTPTIQLLYCQYLAVLFAEIYLDRLFSNGGEFLAELNELVRTENRRLPPNALRYPNFTDDDLGKLAFWMATGSGKTFLMHINLWQYLHYSAGKVRHDNVLLVTPNDGLSKQHLEQLRESGINAKHYGETGVSLSGYGEVPVIVLEITKLTETKRGGGLSVSVDAFGPNNLLFVDEGHRGASGEVWRALRTKVAEEGFTFEYSATFGQIVNGASAMKSKDTSKSKRELLLEEYSKAIAFDYSYPHFYHDGYGKEYWIINLKDESDTFNDWMLLGNLLSFYEQSLVYEERCEAFRPYNLAKPLWIFVGHSVTGGKSREDKTSLTDVEQIVNFFAHFLRHSKHWTGRISKILAGATGLKNSREEDIFQAEFAYLKSKRLSAEKLYERIVDRVFRGKPTEALRAIELKAAEGEIGLRVGASNPYFGVINIGDVAGLLKLLSSNNITCEEENISGSLFESINKTDSAVNVLIGSRKFMEGWDSFRVSSMGLMNIGKGEGSQIIQLFGRGVRLHGKDNSLKRSKKAELGGAPQDIEILETLNVFGVRANYMAQFREYLKQEGIETDLEEVTVPVRSQKAFLDRGLQMLRLSGRTRFQDDDGVVLMFDERNKVRLDLRPRLEIAQSASDEEVRERTSGTNKAAELKKIAPLLNWDRIYFDLLGFKRTKGLHNLSFTRAVLQEILVRADFEVLCPEEQLPPHSFRDVRRLEDLAIYVLRKYVTAFYDSSRRKWEQQHAQLALLEPNDPNLQFGGYKVRVKTDFAEIVRDLINKADKLNELDEKSHPHIYFDRHLYLPVLVSDPRIESMVPPGLNIIRHGGFEYGEARFVRDLRDYILRGKVQLEEKEVFLLRNQTRGKGIGFFEASEGEAFYPDFIFWIIQGEQQWITFIDPHGMRNTRGLSDPKIRLYEQLREWEPKLQAQCRDWKVHLTSFIIAPSSYEELACTSWVRDYKKETFEQHHVVFQDQGLLYVERLVNGIFA